jgi:uncharacterized SAM-binding protein YcdF (DUF218 family)
MSLDVLIVLVLVGLLSLALGWRRTARAVLGLAAVLFLAVGCGLLPAWLLHALQEPYAQRPVIAWAPRNAIVLLGAGAVRTPDGAVKPTLYGYGRIDEALVQYRDCKASGRECKLVVSGGDALHAGRSEAAVYGDLLERMGVPAGDLLLEPHSMNTWQNAQFSAPLLRGYGAQHVVLVSSAGHLRRASLYFAHFGVVATPVRSDWMDARVDWWPQSWNFAMTDLALHEFVGVLRYHVYNALGWNVRATRPGAP